MSRNPRRWLADVRALLIATAAVLCVLPAGAAWATCTPGTSRNTFMASEENDRLVAAEMGSSLYGMLRARTVAPDITLTSKKYPWEAFTFRCVRSDNVYSVQSMQNSRFVSVQKNEPGDRKGYLRAIAQSVGDTELFRVAVGNWGPWGTLGPGSTLRSVATGLYVTAELGGSSSSSTWGMLRARATAVGPWERFWIGGFTL